MGVDLKGVISPCKLGFEDDLLLASSDENVFILNTTHLCVAQVKRGHHASPSKLQLGQKKVKYLGFILGKWQQIMDLERIQVRINFPCAVTKKKRQVFSRGILLVMDSYVKGIN